MNMKVGFYRMISVFLVGNPLKIIGTIVKFVTIFMIYLRLVFRVRNIQLCDQTMDSHCLSSNVDYEVSFAILRKFFLSIPSVVYYLAFWRNRVIV